VIILNHFTSFDVYVGLADNFWQRATFCLMLIFFPKLMIKICIEFQSVINSTNWYNTCTKIITIDKAKPRVIVGRKATDPNFLG